MIGGSQYSKECSQALRANASATNVAGWASAAVLIIATVLFDGTLWNWFAPVSVHWLPNLIQLSLGAGVMGSFVALLGHLLVRRNAIRWGVIVPLLTLGLGTLLALAAGREGSLGLVFGMPVMAGVAVATGLATSFFIGGVPSAALRD